MNHHLFSPQPRWLSVLALLGISLASAHPVLGQETSPEGKPSTSLLIMSGQGEVRVKPDQAMVRLGIEERAPQASAAQEAANSTLQKVIDQIRELGVPESAIQTTTLTLSPVHADRRPGQEYTTPRIVAYRAENLIRVKVKDPKQVGSVVDAAIRSGANRLEEVSFELQDDLPHRLNALESAAQEAATKARRLASALNVRLVRIHKIHSGGYGIMDTTRGFGGERLMAASTPLQPGELTVSASVTVEYEIRATALE